MAYTILIIDKEPMLTDLLTEHLTHNGYSVCTASDSAQTLTQLQHKPDLILLDSTTPNRNIQALCRQIRSHMDCPILVLTEPDQLNQCQNDGTLDFILKPFRLHDLTARIKAYLPCCPRTQPPSTAVPCDGLRIDRTNRTVFFNGVELSFSKREFDLIDFLQSHANQVFDRERLYEAVWGCDAEGNSSTVKEHVRKIRAKLKAATGRKYIETVWSVGYKWKT